MKTSAALCLALLLASFAAADNWPSWRGPNLNGTAPGKGYPEKWSATENVAWKISLPGKGSSTPVIWGERIFLTCGIDGQNFCLAFDKSGKELWRTSVGSDKGGKHKKATGSNPSAVTDGKHVYVYFKSGDLGCLDLDGKLSWKENTQKLFGEDSLWWDLGTSPVLTKDNVIVTVMQTGPSYLAAFDKLTGKLNWKHDRSVPAPSEAAQSYSTPVVLTQDGRETLVVLGADHVTAHDGADGKELWRVGGLNPKQNQYFRSISSPVVADGMVIAPYARGGSITAVKLGGSGDVTSSHVVWTLDNLGADVPTPAAVDGRAYVCTDKGEVACLEVASGKKLWSGAVEKNRNAYSASPILADGKIYIIREDGKAFVLAAGDEFKVIAENELDGEFVVATPVFADGKIYIRTLEKLFCIGK